jgi:hypothetical protein
MGSGHAYAGYGAARCCGFVDPGAARGKRGTYGGTAERVVASSWMATLEGASHK